MKIEKENITIERKKIWLNRYRKAKFKAESLWRQAAEWQDTIYHPSCRVLDGMPGSPGFSNTSDIKIIKHLALVDDAAAATARAEQIRKEILEVIEAVSNLDYVKVLTLRYIEGLDWNSIQEKIHYSRQHTARLHHQALNVVQINQADLDKIMISQNEAECVKTSQNVTV